MRPWRNGWRRWSPIPDKLPTSSPTFSSPCLPGQVFPDPPREFSHRAGQCRRSLFLPRIGGEPRRMDGSFIISRCSIREQIESGGHGRGACRGAIRERCLCNRRRVVLGIAARIFSRNLGASYFSTIFISATYLPTTLKNKVAPLSSPAASNSSGSS